ncbi:RNA exonuclease 5-like isoform X2 [Phycodurus eques]|uniref:RNA exonuclease 5-like isoform X2 n=1 Tax=Phycodurus eques TaxID=693459 RepID=UPI002ACDCEF7|nr:RNA exonuclease 5-like isoform X2 [Phycodurus eques]
MLIWKSGRHYMVTNPMEIDYKRESLLLTSLNGKKRKKNADHHHHHHTHNVAKRVKSEHGGADETEEVEPRISVLPDRLRHPITAEELTELLHYAALGGTRVKQPSWCVLLGQRRVKGVNVVVVEEVSQSDFYKHYITLRNLRTKYSNRLTFTLSTSSSSLLSTIFSSEVDTLEQLAVLQEDKDSSKLHKVLRTHPVVLKYGTSRRGLTAYVLTQEEMIKRHYPVKGLPGFEDFACTDCGDVTDASPLFGLDCEMCLTVKGYELTRVSLVEGEGKCVMDQLVKPDNKILDYLTQFSGITAAMLHPVRTSLRDVQVQLRTLLPRDAVLVGHAVNNDLVALKLIHRHVIDTSLLYRSEFGQRFKLKLLAEVVLGRSIQTQEEKGHHPVEDALAALDLAKYFIRKSPLKVVEDHLEELWGLTQEGEEEEESTRHSTELAPSSRFADVLQRVGRSVCYVGKRCDITLHPAHQQWHNSDRQVVASFRRQSNCPFFSVLRLSSFSNIPPRQDYKVRWCLQDMCVVFAGPLPAGFSEREVRRLFRCCGSVRTVKMLTTTHRIHAVVEFELLEGAALALQMLNGATVQGHTIKVQRPVTESTLDFDLNLDALMSDAVNARRLYTLKLNCQTNGHIADGKFAVNSCTSESLPIKKCELSEEALTQTFTRFGIVERILLMGKPGRQARHAYIQFECSEAKQAAIKSSEGLWQENYVTCPALTPVPVDEDGPHELRGQIHPGPQDMAMCHMMKKLDARLGKIFTSLPECTLSAVLLLAHNSAREPASPGLCLLELKRGKSNNATT